MLLFEGLCIPLHVMPYVLEFNLKLLCQKNVKMHAAQKKKSEPPPPYNVIIEVVPHGWPPTEHWLAPLASDQAEPTLSSLPPPPCMWLCCNFDQKVLWFIFFEGWGTSYCRHCQADRSAKITCGSPLPKSVTDINFKVAVTKNCS